MANDKTIAPKERTIEVMVANRKSIDVDGVVHGPGAKLILPISEAKALYDKGFVVEPDDDADDAGTVTDTGSGPTIQTPDQ